MLDFQPVSMGIKPLVDSYTFKYGEGSCQHSFVSSYCLRQKYGDMFCEHDNFLYTLRSNLCTEHERIYLFPHGDRNNPDAVKNALQNILDDAHANNSRVKFETLTESAKDLVCAMFPDVFEVQYCRDLAEYMYSIDDLVNMPGKHFMTKRKLLHKFFKDYDGRYETLKIAPEHIEQIRIFQGEWLGEKIFRDNNPIHESHLENENNCVQCALDDYFRLGLSGIVIFIDGTLCGYMYGAPLSAECFDMISGKGDSDIPNISYALKYETARLCCGGFKYANFEEDLGIEGLRNMKNLYMPEYLIEKYILVEK